MKLQQLFESRKHVDNEDGSLTWDWKTDLEDEEGKGYIPKGYSKKVLELGGIFANEPGKGQGDRLMKLFLSSPEAKAAELIFLDPVPGIGANFGSNKTEEQQVAALVKFYKRYGFRYNPKSAVKRMWLVQKGTLSDNQLPT